MRRDDIRSTALVGILAFALVPVLAADAGAQLLLEVDGVELHGRARLVMSGAGSCNVLETDTSYEEYKANHGAPMDIWRLDFSVRNGSGRWLDHLIARFEIDSEWPDCTNWSEPDAAQFSELRSDVHVHDHALLKWSGTLGRIQKTGRNVVAPNETLTDTEFFIVLRGDPEPRFSNWSMDFNFGSVNPPSGTPAAADAAPQAVPPPTAELDGLFWQSIMNSTNPADFEAYLEQFPNGVFRALAQNRLAALRAPAGPGAGRAASPASRLRASGDRDPTSPTAASGDSASRFAADETCTGKPANVECWMEIANQPGCYVWDRSFSPGSTVTWTAGVFRRRGPREGHAHMGLLRWFRTDRYRARPGRQEAWPLGRARRERASPGRSLCGRQAARPLGQSLRGRVGRGRPLCGRQAARPLGLPRRGVRPGRPLCGRQAARPLGRALLDRGRRGRPLCGRREARPLGLALCGRDRLRTTVGSWSSSEVTPAMRFSARRQRRAGREPEDRITVR